MSTGAPGGRNSTTQVLYIIVGSALIVVGLALLGAQPLFGWVRAPWLILRDAVSTLRHYGWPLAVMAFGAIVIVYSLRPGAKLPGRDIRLTRSRDKKIIAGVLGGLAEYFDMDVSVVRLGYILLAFLLDAWGPLVMAYIAAAIIVPQAPQRGAPEQVRPSAPPAPASPREEPSDPTTAPPTDVEGDDPE